MASAEINQNSVKNQISKELRIKANDFLNNKVKANNLVELVQYLEKCIVESLPLTSILLTLEVVFVEVLKRRDMLPSGLESQADNKEALVKYRNWLTERYEYAWTLMLKGIGSEKSADSTQSLSTCMKLLAAEGKHPIDNEEPLHFPRKRLRSIMESMLSEKRSQQSVINSFKEFAQYLDVVQNCWSILSIILKKTTSVRNEIWSLNFLELTNAIPLSKSVQDETKLLVPLSEKAPVAERFEYSNTRKFINRVWKSLMLWLNSELTEAVHKQMLIVLLECVLPHLDKPVLLTDFLMDSLDCGGAISLLALQGVFTLIQKHNITYPDIFAKLYSMFEPEIFHTKFKARLFYLADIFLSSTHLPENLVAAFVKRLARLSLLSPPQDAVIILYFIGNLLLRHRGLKKLISAAEPENVLSDPFLMDASDPVKSKALDSSLWEIVALQKHAIPSVATCAKFISQPLPDHEWDLASVLEIKEDDIFDQEISKKAKHYALSFERPQKLFLPKNDKLQKHWSLF